MIYYSWITSLSYFEYIYANNLQTLLHLKNNVYDIINTLAKNFSNIDIQAIICKLRYDCQLKVILFCIKLSQIKHADAVMLSDFHLQIYILFDKTSALIIRSPVRYYLY